MHEAHIRRRIGESIDVKRSLMDQAGLLAEVAAALVGAYLHGKKAIFFGNGGSAADAQHLAAELGGRYYLDRRPLPALALTVNTSMLTAIANDYSYDEIFSRQVEALGDEGDVAFGISTSGNSPNVVAGIRAARRKGLVTVGLAGPDGGLLKDEADFCVLVPAGDTPRIQEAHILVGHILCEIVERVFFAGEGRPAGAYDRISRP